MNMKRSFFDRLSGNTTVDTTFDSFDDEVPATHTSIQKGTHPLSGNSSRPILRDEDLPSGDEGQLPVDVHQTGSDLIIRAFVAGVRPDELNISISRDRVEIEGSRMEREQVSGPDYFTRELFWGSFSRLIMLPQEVDVESSSASAKDGLLTIILPKLDKARQTKLRVKAG
ncbi:MAG: Hsp20/alpha crystallin family protein [Patescibacteria group bacterium]